MEESMHLAMIRYNDMGTFLQLSKSDLYVDIKKPSESFKLNFIPKERKQEIVSLKSKLTTKFCSSVV